MDNDLTPAKAVAYLDLLGFKAATQSNPLAALQLLQDYSDSLETKLRDAERIATQQDVTDELARLNHRRSVSSFDLFLPASDSIVIVSSSPPDLVIQLSDFLLECLMPRLAVFAYPEDPARPTTVTIRCVGPDARTTTSKEEWLPVLFRGGISWGSAWPLKTLGLMDGERTEGHNLMGEAVVSAVALEEQKVKGPRILVSEEFASQVTGDAADYISLAPDLENTHEILWPIVAMDRATHLRGALSNELGELLLGITNLLLFHLSDTKVVKHYQGFLSLILRAAIRRFPEDQHALRDWMQDIIQSRFNSDSVAIRILDTILDEVF